MKVHELVIGNGYVSARGQIRRIAHVERIPYGDGWLKPISVYVGGVTKGDTVHWVGVDGLKIKHGECSADHFAKWASEKAP